MASFIEIVLLIFIAWFLVTQRSGGFSAGVLGRGRRKLILDSCALIDGRIVQLVETGFVLDELVIPQFILSELQLLADGNDAHKRERARFGLDIAHQLQDSAPMKVIIDRAVLADITTTDDKLVALAKKLRAQLYTTDFNLGKVAAVEGVHVLNVNELAQGLRPIALPGETLQIKILQKGSSRDQGVGYLDDGTMIVVDGGARHIASTVPVTVTRMHQTVAGKMVFGQVKEQQVSAQQRTATQAKIALAEHAATGSNASRQHETLQAASPQRQSTSSKLHARLTRNKPADERRPRHPRNVVSS